MTNAASDARTILLIDITSGSVGVGLAGLRDTAVPDMVYTTRSYFGKGEKSEAALEHGLVRALREALADTFKHGLPRLKKGAYSSAVDHATLAFSSPWFITSIGEGNDEIGTDMNTILHKKITQKVEEEIIRHFGLKRGISIQTYPYLFSKVFTHAFPQAHTSLFADVTPHTTDILSLYAGDPIHSISIPFGHATARELEGDAGETLWKSHSDKVRSVFGPARYNGLVYVTSDDDVRGAKALLEHMLPHAQVVAIGADNNFTRMVVHTDPFTEHSERLSLLASFSNIFL